MVDINWNFHWNWSDFCHTGLQPFAAHSKELLPCFQEIVLQFPIYVVFAVMSSYHFGSYKYSVSRDAIQLQALSFRTCISLILAVLPILKIFVFNANAIHLDAVDILVVATECIMWTVHVGYLVSTRSQGERSHRGPLSLNVVWLAVVVLDCVWLRTSLQYGWWPWSLGTLICDISYALTLLPKGNAIYVVQRQTRPNDDEQTLVTPQYTYFHFELNEAHLGHAQDEANWLSRFVFAWVTPLISKGVAGGLKRIEDLFDLPDALHIESLSERMQLAISNTHSLFKALHKAFGLEFYAIGILKFISDISGFAGPLLLGGLLNEEPATKIDSDEFNMRPYLYALGLFGSTLLSAICSSHFNWCMSMMGMKMRTGVVSAIYRKALEARGLKDSRPEILNLMSTDTDRIVNSCISFHSFWSIPFQLFTALYLLYLQLGAAFIAGVVFAALLIPINRAVAQRIGRYSVALMSAKDARLAVTHETLNGARQIKLNAWEHIFIEKIQRFRADELKQLSRRKYLDALCVYFWATTPVLMCFLTFSAAALMNKSFDAASTYTSVALLNMLIGPLNAFPWVLNGLIEAWVSVKRVQELFDLPNLDISSYYTPLMKRVNKTTELDEKPTVLHIKNASFEYDTVKNLSLETDLAAFCLEKVNLEVKKGDLVCIEGPLGAGKSMFIDAIAAAMQRRQGEVCIQDFGQGFGYVPQTPWLQRGTIRDNIVWGGVFDMTWYKSVLFACALNEDIEILGGDMVGMGENGHTLSGGQRARVALARAVYQDKNIYLLDDILSALDAHVAKHIIKYCVLGLLKEKTRIIVTRNVMLFFHANNILHVENGEVTRSEFMSESIDLSLENSADDEQEQESLRRRSIDLDELQQRQETTSVDSIMLEESRATGYISMNVFKCYWHALTTPLALGVLSLVLLMQLSRNMSDAWLANWVTETTLNNTNFTFNDNGTTPHTLTYYLGIYAALTLGNSLLSLARAFIFAYAGLRAAKFIHERLLKSVIFARFNFFDITSVGRILNRFSSDTYTIDDSLPFILNILLAMFFSLAGAIIVSLYAMPWLALVIIPMVPIYLHLQQSYRHASRDIKRLSSNAMSPLYTHFTETLQGLITIRTMRASIRFQRDFHAKLAESIKAQLTSSAAQQWLGLRMQLLGALLVGGAGILAAITSAHASSPGLVGLSISYALSITGLLSGLLNAIAETEQELISVERVDQYLQLPAEHNVEGNAEAPFGWPSQGVLSFKNVQLRYRDHLIPALHDVSFETGAFERVAIVGRTGAGKSSILAALLRIAPLSRGTVTLDCVNVHTLPLHVLRSRVCIMPQEAFLFEGTVRDNLDPKHDYHDSEIWHAMANCWAATYLVQSLGGLDGWLEKGGENLSAGQRQLLCLARTLLKNAKVICIDEGTSNLDDDCDMAMQQALRSAFKRSTVLFIAHRLRGLQSMDRIIVMEGGDIREQGTPAELAHNPRTLFYAMLQAQNISVDDF